MAVRLALLAAAICGVAVLAQSPPVTFRVEVNYVEVDALVTDADGNPVTDLSADDFEVQEDGRPQKVAAFSLVNIPVERSARPLFASSPIEADVQTNDRIEGRLYLIVLDDLHTAPTRTPRVREAARRFVEDNLGANDIAAVVYTSGRAADSQEFTSNRRLLLAAIGRFTGRKFQSATVDRLQPQNLQVSPEGRVTPGDDSFRIERAHRARTLMSSVRKLADFMAGVRGRRKAMLLFSEGIDYDIHNLVSQSSTTSPSSDLSRMGDAEGSAVMLETREAIAAATRANVSIYAIDPRGLTAGVEELISVSSVFPEQGADGSAIMGELRLAHDSLREVAGATGGFAALNRNDYAAAFDRIVAENSSYYVLGYYAQNDRREGRYRRLDVRVKRPGLRVRARTGYFEPRGRRREEPSPLPKDVSPAVADALASPIPATGLPMRVFAMPFKGAAPNAAVALAVEVDVSSFNFVEKNGTFVEQLEVVHTAMNHEGKAMPGERHSIGLNLKPDTYERVRTGGIRVLSQANLPPGRYQLRIAAGSRDGKSGSVLYDLEVPDFHKAPLSMSGLALTSAASARMTTLKPRDPLADFLPAPPTTARVFPRGDTLALFVELYENAQSRTPHVIDFRAELRADGGQVVQQASEQRSSTELQGKAGGYGFAARLSLDVAPGVYVLHVEGRSRAGDQPAISRDVQIEVR